MVGRPFEDRQRIGLGTSGELASAAVPAMRSSWFFTINITHIPTAQDVSFEGWVTSFSDSYNPQWNSQPVYGRMDPLSTYQGTGRTISLAFDIINESPTMAKDNFERIAKFMKFQYPVYESGELSQQNVLKAAPLLAIKWTNLISSPNNVGQKLVGFINGAVSYSPQMEEGGFLADEIVQYGADPDGTGDKSAIRNYIPKKVSLNFTFTVLHTHLVGWANPLSEQAMTALAESGQQNVSTYFFGGNPDIDSRFPNTYKQFPPAEHLAAARRTIEEERARALLQDGAMDETTRELFTDGDLNVPAVPGDSLGANGDAIRQHIAERTAALEADEKAKQDTVLMDKVMEGLKLF